ncbi:MAG: DUF445 family protein [Spirochaetaceae bacterium]|jgi:uncharacterized membrane protein YheB (UPF0754 family)|nr:DUF445 family protein [Spirochaetaceae bacterium]
MKTVLLWLVPPFVGAGIGFLTNVLAIKMLFRPLRAYHVGPFQVPFTPGILPREREVLAKSIGAMVARELLTPEIIRSRLEQDDVRQLLMEVAAKLADKIDGYYPKLRAHLVQFLKKPETHRELEAFGHRFLSGVMQKLNPVQKLFASIANYDQKLTEKMPEIIDDLIENIDGFLVNDSVRMRFLVLVETELGKAEHSEKFIAAVNDAIPDMLRKFDIAGLVENRINSLPMERVERIVLDVMADKFKWIDIFGAILGFLIGVFQAAFSFLVNQ